MNRPHKHDDADTARQEPGRRTHVHAEIIKAWADGAEIEMRCSDGTWVVNSFPAWIEAIKYRVKPVVPHKWQKEMEAQAAGKAVQFRASASSAWVNGRWHFDCTSPGAEYRVKPPEFQHKWKKEIEAYTLHGKTVQWRTSEEGAPWRDFIDPSIRYFSYHRPEPDRYATAFDDSRFEFRIKPETVVAEYRVERADDKTIWFGPGKHNLRLKFEDGKLVASEVIG